MFLQILVCHMLRDLRVLNTCASAESCASATVNFFLLRINHQQSSFLLYLKVVQVICGHSVAFMKLEGSSFVGVEEGCMSFVTLIDFQKN